MAASSSSSTAPLFGNAPAADKPPAAPRMLPWVEKYRPKNVDEISHQQEVVDALKTSLKTGNLPHLLFYGPPGTGKTSTILAVAHQLFGPQTYRKRILELNASDERGIAVIQKKVKGFAQLAVGAPTERGYPCPPFKLVILDEADQMTGDAQTALRRTMETYSKVTRFVILCNYVSRIIDPLVSRCAKFRFKPLSTDTVIERLRFIAQQEKVDVNDEVLQTLEKVSEGDMRKAITSLQSACQLHGTSITADAVLSTAGVFPPAALEAFLAACSLSFDAIQDMVGSVMAEGYSAHTVLTQLSKYVCTSPDCKFNDLQKAKVSIKVAEVEKCLNDGADELLQLTALASFISKC